MSEPLTPEQMRTLLAAAMEPRSQFSDALAWTIQVLESAVARLELHMQIERDLDGLRQQVERLERADGRLEKRVNHLEGRHGS